MDKGLEDLLKLVMNYVNDADKHRVDKLAIEQRLQDIEDDIENLAIEIENGEFEESNNEWR